MRRLFIVAVTIAVCVLPSVASAQTATTEVQGFGGLTFGSSTFGSTSASTFGGRVAIDLMPNMQIIGEGGRMSDIKSPLFDLLDYCAEHGIVCNIEKIAIDKINEAYERMLKSDVKYRFVIDMASLD